MQEKLKRNNLEIGDYFDCGWEIFQKNFMTFLSLALLINLPIAIVAEFLPLPLTPTGEIAWTPEDAKIWGIFYIIATIFGIWTTIATLIVSENAVFDRSLDVKTALQSALPTIAIVVLMSLLSGILVGLGLIFFVIPGIYIAISLAFVTQFIVLRHRGLGSIAKSWSLVKGQWWKVFWRLFVIGFALFLLLLALTIVASFISIVFSAFPIAQNVINVVFSVTFGLLIYLGIVIQNMLFLNLDYVRNNPDRPI
ncbi:MAG: hypothetical protein J7641_15790 [Cyanobacteria bacterium SID2]|nr:hypothetical protein [Cyanobacteria bacterium SID2]MBP0003635.1 hypothetical protein [Cyanobacteria bacterium SBC]